MRGEASAGGRILLRPSLEAFSLIAFGLLPGKAFTISSKGLSEA